MEVRAGALLRLAFIVTLALVVSCAKEEELPEKPADLILTSGRVYTFNVGRSRPRWNACQERAPHRRRMGAGR